MSEPLTVEQIEELWEWARMTDHAEPVRRLIAERVWPAECTPRCEPKVAAEREACAKIADDHYYGVIAAAIRARSTKP